MVDSRAKGARLERLAAQLLRTIGFAHSERCQQFQGLGSDGDVRTPDVPIHWEVKGRKELTIYRFMEQACRDARRGRVPAVLLKADSKPWLLMLRAEDLPHLLEACKEAFKEANVGGAQAETT